MILQALRDYYLRKPELPRDGYELKEISFVIELEPDGRVTQVIDTRETQGRKKIARGFLVPQGIKKSVNVAANLLWGNAEYVLSLPDTKKLAERQAKGKESEYRERLNEMHETFVARIRSLPDEVLSDQAIVAVLKFLSKFEPDQSAGWGECGQEIRESNPNLTFRLRGDTNLVCQRPAVADAIANRGSAIETAFCLVTGNIDEIERLHPAVGGVSGANPTGATLVSFQKDSGYDSYGKVQGQNAPVGKQAVFAYTTALKYLLRRGSPQKMQIGDATTIFWSDAASPLEDDFAAFFNEPRKDDADPDRGTRAVAALLESAKQGVGPALDDRTRFFVLGLASNSARIAIRFWHVGTVAKMAGQIVRHFYDLEMTWLPGKQNKETGFLPVSRLLKAVAFDFKVENAPPNLGGEIMHAILQGQPYPETLFQNAIRRIRMECDVGYPRAAILKACLNRKSKPNEKEITVSLDKDNTNSGYRLGRLFAVLERVQEEASPGLNATIRDRYYAAFSATPASVFATLMRMKNHHLAKLDNPGRRANLEKLIGEIVGGLPPAPPAHLSLSDQGRFAIGYYHQRMDPGTYKSPAKENDNG